MQTRLIEVPQTRMQREACRIAGLLTLPSWQVGAICSPRAVNLCFLEGEAVGLDRVSCLMFPLAVPFVCFAATSACMLGGPFFPRSGVAFGAVCVREKNGKSSALVLASQCAAQAFSWHWCSHCPFFAWKGTLADPHRPLGIGGCWRAARVVRGLSLAVLSARSHAQAELEECLDTIRWAASSIGRESLQERSGERGLLKGGRGVSRAELGRIIWTERRLSLEQRIICGSSWAPRRPIG